MTSEIYAIYLTSAQNGMPAGYVVNNIVCPPGAEPTTSSGQVAVADPDRKYPIGSIYTADSA
ncbi:MAG: hypothetical protein ABF979_16535 [Gluconobacter sp.]|uniref:hypothetical protein n=1 Tax=unclassified Gluconobacter TaxID=2644261 RepID=UPI00175D5E37|nr:hypothetical protein [Gluconobacter sp. Gdi]GFE96591.1 hypothetical protein DmGdi_16640 [Gluconobacter sp. Gdi]